MNGGGGSPCHDLKLTKVGPICLRVATLFVRSHCCCCHQTVSARDEMADRDIEGDRGDRTLSEPGEGTAPGPRPADMSSGSNVSDEAAPAHARLVAGVQACRLF